MRITALYDPNGVILAAVAVDDAYDGPVPVASEGTEVGTFDVPTSVGELPLDELCVRHRIDTESRQLTDAER
jgi:hypothetical protein